MLRKCNLSNRCRFHRKWDNSALTCYTSTGFDNIKWLQKHDRIDKFNEINDLVCQVLNLEALGNLMSKHGMKIHNVSIHDTFPTVAGGKKCWGYNKGKGDVIALKVVKYGGVLLTRDELLSLLIHELVHMDIREHDEHFYEKEASYRNFIKSRMYIKIWEGSDHDVHFESVLWRSIINDVVDKINGFKSFILKFIQTFRSIETK